MNMSKIYEGIITKKVTEKAKELGIEFKVKHTIKDEMDDFLLRIKRSDIIPTMDTEIEAYHDELRRQREFADFVSDIVIGNYANQIRFSYPSKL